MKRVIGITGGIGSGKSTVSNILREEYGAHIIDCDELARDILMPGEKAYREVVEHFGRDILTGKSDNGYNIDRKKLADIVFNDLDELKKLEFITHKYVYEEIKKRLQRISCVTITTVQESPVVGVEASVPDPDSFRKICGEIWTVVSPLDVRIKRVMERSGLTFEDVEKRIAAQKKDESYIEFSDKVIYNPDDIDKLKEEIKKAL